MNRDLQSTAKNAADAAAAAADSLAHKLANGVDETLMPPLHRAADRAAELTRRGVDALQEGTQAVRRQAVAASDTTRAYIRDEPMKSVLIAAATGAALMALVNVLGRSRER